MDLYLQIKNNNLQGNNYFILEYKPKHYIHMNTYNKEGSRKEFHINNYKYIH